MSAEKNEQPYNLLPTPQSLTPLCGIIYNTIMQSSIVIDTNVLISALRSKNGASFKVISLIGTDRFRIAVSVPLILEYESVAKRQRRFSGLTDAEIDDILDYVCGVAIHQRIFFLWRPFLRDPMDDMLLELAVASESYLIVTHNVRHFEGIEQFGIRALTPRAFLEEIGDKS